MSLAVTIAPGLAGAPDRLVTTVGGVMTSLLALSAWEQWRDSPGSPHWLVPLCAGLVCAAWSVLLVRRNHVARGGYRDQLRYSRSLVIAPDGRIRLEFPSTAGPQDGVDVVDVVVAKAWGLGSLIYLRVVPVDKVVQPERQGGAGQSIAMVAAGGPCGWLLAKQDFCAADWHALRRWLVWHRRSGHGLRAPV